LALRFLTLSLTIMQTLLEALMVAIILPLVPREAVRELHLTLRRITIFVLSRCAQRDRANPIARGAQIH